VLDGPGVLSPALRRNVFEGRPLGDPVADRYVETVRRHAYKVVDGTIAELRAAGWSEDQIFELSVTAAFGAASQRLEAGLHALEAATRSSAATGRVD